jgi:hypothetical protein
MTRIYQLLPSYLILLAKNTIMNVTVSGAGGEQKRLLQGSSCGNSLQNKQSNEINISVSNCTTIAVRETGLTAMDVWCCACSTCSDKEKQCGMYIVNHG